jgi:hypothetical protein
MCEFASTVNIMNIFIKHQHQPSFRNISKETKLLYKWVTPLSRKIKWLVTL